MLCVCWGGGGGCFVVLTTAQKHFSNAPTDLLHFLLPALIRPLLLVSIKSLWCGSIFSSEPHMMVPRKEETSTRDTWTWTKTSLLRKVFPGMCATWRKGEGQLQNVTTEKSGWMRRTMKERNPELRTALEGETKVRSDKTNGRVWVPPETPQHPHWRQRQGKNR